jgi:hypothetical protein
MPRAKRQDSTEDLITERSSRYGSMADNAACTQGLMRVVEQTPGWSDMSDVAKESIHMIFHKISRAACGDPMYDDNPKDIGGYARLWEEWIHANNS